MAARERSTQEVMETLGEDYDRCHKALVDCIDAGKKDKNGNVTADYEFFARQLIRAAFAYIEAVTFSVKAHSAWQCMERNLPIEPEERYFATDIEFEISEKGEVVERSARISLPRNVRFALCSTDASGSLRNGLILPSAGGPTSNRQCEFATDLPIQSCPETWIFPQTNFLQ
jgi:hypothetical protein